jgi:hypothetical protein
LLASAFRGFTRGARLSALTTVLGFLGCLYLLDGAGGLQEQGYELLTADIAVSIAINFIEDLLDLLAGLTALQKLGDFIVADFATVVYIEIVEGTPVVFSGEVLLRVGNTHQKLSILNVARAVEVDESHDGVETLLVLDVLLHDGFELGEGDDAVVVGVAALEDGLEALLFGFAQQLRNAVCVHHCLQLVFELTNPNPTPKCAMFCAELFRI